MLVRIQMGTNTAENQQQRLSLILLRNREFISRGTNNQYHNCLENNNIFTQKLRSSSLALHQKTKMKKTRALYLSVKLFSTKMLTGDTIFTFPTGDGTAILRGHPSHAKLSPLVVQRKYLHFSVILRPRVLVQPRESDLATFRSAVKRSPD